MTNLSVPGSAFCLIQLVPHQSLTLLESWSMDGLVEGHCDSVGLLGYQWDREKWGVGSIRRQTGKHFVYGSLFFPSSQPPQVRFREIIIRDSLRKKGWSSKVCLRICGVGGRAPCFAWFRWRFCGCGGSCSSFEAPVEEVVMKSTT